MKTFLKNFFFYANYSESFFVLDSKYHGDALCQVWSGLNNFLTYEKDLFLKVFIRINRKFTYKNLTICGKFTILPATYQILIAVLQPHKSAIEIPRDSIFKVVDKGNTLRP